MKYTIDEVFTNEVRIQDRNTFKLIAYNNLKH